MPRKATTPKSAAVSARKIKVLFGNLARPLTASEIASGTTLEDFLKRRDLSFSAAVRINAKVATRTQVLREGDIVTVTQAVTGGR